jgi:hypothetical protein
MDKELKDRIIFDFENKWKNVPKIAYNYYKEHLLEFDERLNNKEINYSEVFYILKYGENKKCKYGNATPFFKYATGYRTFCGTGKKCKCKLEFMSVKMKEMTHSMNEDQKKSKTEKTKKTNLEKYGGHFSKTDEFKNRVKQTSIEKYGVENYSQTNEYKEKVKQTNIEKYGVFQYSQTNDFKERVKKTNLERYGAESPMQVDEFKEKLKQTILERYGVENPMQMDEFKNKIKQTNLERYGVESYSRTEEFREKAKQTNLERYGDHPSRTLSVKEKVKQTNLERYGVEIYKRKHYNPDYMDIFDNSEDFKKILYEHGTYMLAEMINCDVSTVHLMANQYNIPLPPRPKSYQEEQMVQFLENNNISFITNTKKIIPSGLELDFYFPNHNLAIEINGLYWHSEISGGKDKNYHYNKWKDCNELGITLLSINEDEFYERQQFWFNKILYMTGKLSLKKIHARKCKVVELDNVSEFLNEHHLQGSCNSTHKLGLIYEDQLVSVMTFGNPRSNKSGTIDLSRFCNHSGYLISGGASRLLSNFIKKYGNDYDEIISFSDNNYSNGTVYKTLGFSLDYNLSSDYKYIINEKTYHKALYRKAAIFKKFDIPEDIKDCSEWELMQYLGHDRIWDTGKKKWILKL